MKLISHTDSFETKAAVLDINNRVLEFNIQRVFDLNFGASVPAVITAAAPMNGAWFARADNGNDLFIQKTKEPLYIGQRVVARIEKEARLGKCAAGQLVTKPAPTPTPVDILQKKYPDAVLSDDASFDWEAAEDEALAPQIHENNVRLLIDRTAVCWTIDIDSANADDSFDALNRTAVPILARQITLKNMAGLILIDFIGFKHPKCRQSLKTAMVQALAHDSRVSDIDWTHNGLMELKRRRESAPLMDKLCVRTHTSVLNPETTFIRLVNRLKQVKNPTATLITAHPTVIALLQRHNIAARFRADATVSPDSFDLS